MEENKVATDSVEYCKKCGKEVPDATREVAWRGKLIVYCSYECYCDD